MTDREGGLQRKSWETRVQPRVYGSSGQPLAVMDGRGEKGKLCLSESGHRKKGRPYIHKLKAARRDCLNF